MPIRKLPDDVIIRISAGEVITSYYDIIKELLENSLDAQATEIEIIIPEKKNDGPGIEIRDNGIGIEKDDFVLLCARHCTSKFKSLDEISSFGFRGEALASIALIADVTVESYASFITEKITGEGCNYDADHGCHTKDVENSEAYGYIGEYKNANLVSLKPKAMKKGTFIRINNIHKECTLKMDKRECITLIVNYQLDNPNVKITMNGIGDAYHTFLSPFDRSKIINHFYKTGDLIIDESERYCFVSSYPLKKFTLVLFVNGRLVTNTKIRNEILKIYKKIFPTKKFPFVYLSLKINHVDVNVHPRKKEVLIEQMPDLDFIGDVMDNKRGIKKIKTVDFKSSNNEVGAKNAKKIYTDPTESTIEESILSSINESIPFDSAKSQNTNIANNSYGNRNFLKLLGVSTDFVDKRSNSEIVKVEYNRGNDRGKDIFHFYNLKSLKSLKSKQTVVDATFFKGLVFVGTYEDILYVQKDSFLLESQISKLLRVFFYQKILFSFGNYRTLRYKINPFENPRSKDEKTIVGLFEDKANKLIFDILSEYFMIDVKSSIYPVIGPFVPEFGNWSSFIFKVLTIKWDTEEDLFEKIMRMMAGVFVGINLKDNFRFLKSEIMGTRESLECFTIVSCLGELFKHFERC